MPTLERDDVVDSLCKKGFSEQDGGDHRYFRLLQDGKDTGIFTMVSRGGRKYRTLGNDLVSKMAKQLKLQTKEFVQLVECTMTGDAYVALLREKKEL